MPDDSTRLPPLKTDPKYGYYPWWPEDGDAWLHPEDVSLARTLIPSPRVWRRDGEIATRAGGGLVVLHYGELRLRVRRALWRELPPPAFEVGDWVEVRPRGLANEPNTGRIRELHWDEHAGVARYELTLADGTRLEKAFVSDDLKPVEPRVDQPEAYREPPNESGDDLSLLGD